MVMELLPGFGKVFWEVVINHVPQRWKLFFVLAVAFVALIYVWLVGGNPSWLATNERSSQAAVSEDNKESSQGSVQGVGNVLSIAYDITPIFLVILVIVCHLASAFSASNQDLQTGAPLLTRLTPVATRQTSEGPAADNNNGPCDSSQEPENRHQSLGSSHEHDWSEEAASSNSMLPRGVQDTLQIEPMRRFDVPEMPLQEVGDQDDLLPRSVEVRLDDSTRVDDLPSTRLKNLAKTENLLLDNLAKVENLVSTNLDDLAKVENLVSTNLDDLARVKDELRSHRELVAREEEKLRSCQELVAREEEKLRSCQELVAREKDKLRTLQELSAREEDKLRSCQELSAREENKLRSCGELLAKIEDKLRSRQEFLARVEDQLQSREDDLLQRLLIKPANSIVAAGTSVAAVVEQVDNALPIVRCSNESQEQTGFQFNRNNQMPSLYCDRQHHYSQSSNSAPASLTASATECLQLPDAAPALTSPRNEADNVDSGVGSQVNPVVDASEDPPVMPSQTTDMSQPPDQSVSLDAEDLLSFCDDHFTATLNADEYHQTKTS